MKQRKSATQQAASGSMDEDPDLKHLPAAGQKSPMVVLVAPGRRRDRGLAVHERDGSARGSLDRCSSTAAQRK